MNFEVTFEEYGRATVTQQFVRESDAWVEYWTWVQKQPYDGYDALPYTYRPEVIAMRMVGGDWGVTLRKL
jgi:hypothetical protein